MLMTPLSDRILIKPELAPTQTASGLHLAEHWKPEQTGTIVAIGRPKHPRKDEAFKLAKRLDKLLTPLAQSAAQLLRALTGREPDVHVGDYVLFSWQAGQEVWVNDGEHRYLLMREDDILAVIGDPALETA